MIYRLVLLFLLFTPATALTQRFDTLRFCTYNLLSFDEKDTGLVDEYRMILNAIGPHVLTVQEITTQEGYRLFADEIAAKLDRPLVGVGIAYDAEHSSYSSAFYDPEFFRDNGRWVGSDTPADQFVLDIYHKGSGRRLAVMSLYWKAGSTSADRAARVVNARSVRSFHRTTGPQVFGILATGDLNVYNSGEEAYQNLLRNEDGEEIFFDPIDRPGEWSGDSLFFADLHTQSTRTRQFGGGFGSGLDDRFDFIMLSEPLLDFYIPGSYVTFGNDGKHFDDSVNAPDNTAVSAAIAQALYDASDHLPVCLDLALPLPSSSVNSPEKQFSCNVSRIGPDRILFTFPGGAPEEFRIVDVGGRVVFDYNPVADGGVGNDERIVWEAEDVPGGVYLWRARLEGEEVGGKVEVRAGR